MQFWQSISYNSPEDCVALAQTAEAAGFDGVSLAEHIFHPLQLASKHPYSAPDAPAFEVGELWAEVWTTLTAMGMATRTLQLATAVNILPLHNPFELAKTTGTVARLTQNRIAIGCGAGWMKEEFDAFGVDFSTRGKRFNESIRLMRALWSGNPVTFHGDFFHADAVLMVPPPTRPVPFWVGGSSPAAIRRAALLGDGWMATGEPVAETLRIIGELKALRREAGLTAPFAIMAIQPFATLTPGTVSELADAGATSIKNYTFRFVMDNPRAPLAEKQDYLKRMGDTFISRFR